MKKLMIIIILLLAMSGKAFAWNYPRDGKFKQLNPRRDPWCFVDEGHWDIQAPDKWQHAFGSYLLQRFLQNKMNKYLVATVIVSGSIYKELAEDAYREGWSGRDLFCGLLGIVNAIYLPNNMIVTYQWGPWERNVMLHVVIHFNP